MDGLAVAWSEMRHDPIYPSITASALRSKLGAVTENDAELARLMLVCGGRTGLVGVRVVGRSVVEDSVIPAALDTEPGSDFEPVASVPDGPVEPPPEAVGESGPPDPDVPVLGAVGEVVV